MGVFAGRDKSGAPHFGAGGRAGLWSFWHAGARSLLDERGRWKLWIPVFFGIGAGLYFALSYEPGYWAIGTALALALIGIVTTRPYPAIQLSLIAGAIILSGAGWGQIHTHLAAAPVLEKKTRPVTVSATVTRVEPRDGKYRLWLDDVGISRYRASAIPERIRISVSIKDGYVPTPGQRISVRAVLYPPSGPAAPGAFDFSRRAWFSKIGGVGYAVSAPRLIDDVPETGAKTTIANLRHGITRNIMQALPGHAGAIAAALITGERGAIPDDILENIRRAGLAHLLAISGLYLGLVGGFLFFAIRFGLALIPGLAVCWPVKKWAAILALAGSFFYLLISGGTLPTQRAFIMLGLVFMAIIFDRNPFSMNLVALAAMAILLLAPESIVNVSFQMSFAAVVALIAAYEADYARRINGGGARGPVRRVAGYGGAVLLTTAIAGFATAPFALYHFNQAALFGMLANMAAVPLTAFLVMPLGIIALLGMPFGVEGWALAPMGWGTEIIMAIAAWVSALPGSVLYLPSFDGAYLALAVLGGLWLCLWQKKWRWLGVFPMAAALAGALYTTNPAEILVSKDAKKVGIRTSSGSFIVLGAVRGFVSESWARRSGVGKPVAYNALDGKARQQIDLCCDRRACFYRDGAGNSISVLRDPAALSEDCRIADIVIAPFPVHSRGCPGPAHIIDRFSVWRHGAYAIQTGAGTIRIDTVSERQGNRLWSRYPRKRR